MKGPCIAAQLEATQQRQVSLACDYSGNFNEVQCPQNGNQCFCVDKMTGQPNGRTPYTSFGRTVCIAKQMNNMFSMFG